MCVIEKEMKMKYDFDVISGATQTPRCVLKIMINQFCANVPDFSVFLCLAAAFKLK